MSATRNVTYRIEHGTAQSGEPRHVFRQEGGSGQPYITTRGRFTGGEQVTRILTTHHRKDGKRTINASAFRNPLHARAWLSVITPRRRERL